MSPEPALDVLHIFAGGLPVRPEDVCPNNYAHEFTVRPWPESQTPVCKWCHHHKGES